MIKIINGLEYKFENKKWVRNINENEVIRIYEKYKTINKVSKIIKIDNSTVKRILLKNNIKINSHKDSLKISMNRLETKIKCSISNIKSKEKRKNTCLKKYGVEYASQSEVFQDKVKETSITKYGTYHFLKNINVQNKRKNTCLKKYGVDNISKVDEIKLKKENTCFSNYGVYCSFQSEEIKTKIENYFQFKYNAKNPSQIKELKEKKKNTCLKKYGVDNIMKSVEMKKYFSKKSREKFLTELPFLLSYLNLELIDSEYKDAHFKHKWKCLKCNNEFMQLWNLIQQGYTCPICYPRNNGTSKGEKEVFDFIKSILSNVQIEKNTRTIISPFELDIYIPSKKIAIEYNGLYWHSDQTCIDPSNYHINKTRLCLNNNIQLIQIFEDEWIFKKEIVKKRLEHILNTNNKKRIHSRKCVIKEIDSKTKNEFLDKFHIQGKDLSVIKLGAFYNNELVSVMTFSHGNISKGSKNIENVWELNRFCSDYNYNIPGIAGKLLTFFERNYEWKTIYSYADLRWSRGDLYHKLGFNFICNTTPGYWYTRGYKRIHRYSLRKTTNEPKEIPEYILRQSQGYYRIWDCGNLKFIKNHKL